MLVYRQRLVSSSQIASQWCCIVALRWCSSHLYVYFLFLYLNMMKTCGSVSFRFPAFKRECLTGIDEFWWFVCLCLFLFICLMICQRKTAMMEFVKGFITGNSSSLSFSRTTVGSRYLQLHCFPFCPSSVLILNVTERGGDIMLICNGF